MSAMAIPTTCTRLALSLAITFGLTVPAGLQGPPNGGGVPEPADKPAPRTDQNSTLAHAQLVDKAKQGRIDVYFLGDSIVRRWGALDYPELLENWKQNFYGWNAADFGWGADRHREHPLASRERRVGRRQSEGHRSAGRNEQCRIGAARRADDRGDRARDQSDPGCVSAESATGHDRPDGDLSAE